MQPHLARALLRAADNSYLPFLAVYLGVAWLLWGDGRLADGRGGATALARWLCAGWIPAACVGFGAYAVTAARGRLCALPRAGRLAFAALFAASLPAMLAAVEWGVHRLHAGAVPCDGILDCSVGRAPAEAAMEPGDAPIRSAETTPPGVPGPPLAPGEGAAHGHESRAARETATSDAPSAPGPAPIDNAAGRPTEARALGASPRDGHGNRHGDPDEGAAASGAMRRALAPRTERGVEGRILARGAVRIDPATGEELRAGPWVFFDAESGRAIAEGSFADGKREGAWTEWHPNGQVKLRGSYRDGALVGAFQTWHENGRVALRRDEIRTDDGRVLWNEEGFHPNGRRSSQSQYVNGRLHGPQRSWYADGTPRSAGAYRDGEKHGLWVYWTANGERRGIEAWEAGRLVKVPPAASPL